MKDVHSAEAKTDIKGQEKGGVAAQNGTRFGTVTAQKRGRRSEADRTAELAGTLPRGIRIGVWGDGRSKPFFVRHGKERTVQSFASEQERNDCAEKLAQAKEEGGTGVLNLNVAEWREWVAFRARCPAPLAELERLWHERGTGSAPLVKDAVPRYLKLRLAEDIHEDSDTYRHMKLHLQRLIDRFGPLRIDQVHPDSLRELMAELKGRKAGTLASKDTKRDHRKNWNTFFQRAVDEEWCSRNPCAKVKPPKIRKQEKEPLPPRAIFDLLKANRDEPVVGRMVLELFGGLRAASAERLKKEHLKFDTKGIRMPGAVRDPVTGEIINNHKSGTTKFRQGHPAVLWAWLHHVGDAAWTEITEANYAPQKSEAFKRAGVINPGNVLRDTFCSYHLAAFKDRALTALLMQHKRMNQTETYEGVAEEADAKLVMAMMPETVTGTFEALLESHKTRT